MGTIVNGRREGLGKVTYANGDLYQGNFADDQRSGQGKFIGADGYKY